MADIAELVTLIEPEAQAEGLALVRVKMIGGTSDPTLQVMAERPDTRQLTLDDCARLSRRISDRLDALEAEGRDPIEDAYRLEVSSPGIDRPLTRLSDYRDWKGHEARIHLVEPLEGRKQLSGDLIGVEGESVLIDVRGLGSTAIPFAAIRNAKLLMTDRLLAATAPLLAEGADVEEIEDNEDNEDTEEGQD
jgi:ribosome maturation factor RimP